MASENPIFRLYDGFITVSDHMLKIHKVIPPNRKIYRCDLCDYVCIKPNLIKEHRLRHTGKPSLQCPHCDKVSMALHAANTSLMCKNL